MFKKIIFAVAVMLAPVVMQAQRPAFFGIRTSFDVTHPAGCNDGINNGSGLTVMGVYNIPIGKNLFIEPGVGIFYNTMGIKPFEDNNAIYDGSVRNFGIRIPVNIGYRVGLFDNFELAAFTGPWFNINCSTKAHLQADMDMPVTITSPSMFEYGWHHFDAQWGFGISATYADKYYLAISGGIGMSAMATFNNHDGIDRMRRNTLSITIGYNF